MQKQITRNEPISSYKWIVLLIATISQTCATFVTYGIDYFSFFMAANTSHISISNRITCISCQYWIYLLNVIVWKPNG